MPQKKMFNENLKVVLLDNLNNTHKETEMAGGVITIDTPKEKMKVPLNKTRSDNVYPLVDAILYEHSQNKQTTTVIHSQPTEKSAV